MNQQLVTGKMYLPALDALRFLAVAASFLHHNKIIHFLHGHTFFFLLGAFMLTRLAQREYQSTGKFSLPNFTARRFLRIAPVYFATLLTGFVLVPLFARGYVSLPEPAYYLTFTANYYTEPHLFALSVLWAVSVQEQFYLFISLCFRFLYRHLLWIALGMILFSCGYKYLAFIRERSIYFDTLNHFSSFGMGILLAIGVEKEWFRKLYDMSGYIRLLIYLAIAALFYFATGFTESAWWHCLDNIVMSVAFSYIVLETCFFRNGITRLNKAKRLQYLGKISFGLYCYQGFVITAGTMLMTDIFGKEYSIWFPLFNFPVLIFLAHFSYRLYERRFLKLKNRFRTYPSTERL